MKVSDLKPSFKKYDKNINGRPYCDVRPFMFLLHSIKVVYRKQYLSSTLHSETCSEVIDINRVELEELAKFVEVTTITNTRTPPSSTDKG